MNPNDSTITDEIIMIINFCRECSLIKFDFNMMLKYLFIKYLIITVMAIIIMFKNLIMIIIISLIMIFLIIFNNHQ